MRGDAKCALCGRGIFKAWIDGIEQPWKHWVEPTPDKHLATPEPAAGDFPERENRAPWQGGPQ